ncbi:MAG TPA: aminotransferase class V-fold PLP-dependent enzyme [Candidatus Thalassarchaeaceae archaeon]|nr:MAG TPA: aminotransferase class V-fold PLP-dependent enzyme [Candidatus Poseidoniales archaeon]HIH80130.1 aminotransferase class V-fold PLP-dependent enzyme [Candidatus Thalassarchaeaceae archaeon]HJM30019.1 aminotransferase class V-fold PLP-dependent enzyme [Candidatus Thalassarchaeaceae archaeon]|tara:strand:+ start:1162 stop:2388 length:1227 start_codon:yes stop_codon:yes gene_type:complete
MALDIQSIRADFPILERILPNGKKLVYFDNAATSQKPKCVIEAMTQYYEQYNSNAHRANHTLADEATAALENARLSISRYFGTSPANLIYTSGATEAINLAAYGWARYNLERDDVIVVTEMEHHADIVPWQEMSKEKGIELRYVPIDTKTFTLDMDAFEVALEGAKLVCVVHTSNVLGVRNPVEDIIEKSHAVGARVLIDCAQGAPHERIFFDNLGADFVAISAHKMAGPTGIGCLLVKSEAMEQMGPFMTGGSMIRRVTTEGSVFQEGHAMFETGTPRIAEAIGWGAAVEWLSQFDMREVHSHIQDIASWTADQMLEIPGIRVFGDPSLPGSSGAVSFLHDSIQSQDLAFLLDEGGFAVRTGHHCAQPLMDALGVPSTNRASFWIYNTLDEAQAFVSHLRYVCERFT